MALVALRRIARGEVTHHQFAPVEHAKFGEYALDMGAKNDRLLNYIIDGKLEEKLNDRNFMEPLIQQMLAD